MKADKTFSGVTPDYGTILRVNTKVTSESTAALMEQLSIYDSAYMGGHLRPIRRAIFVDRPMFGLSMMANNIPAVEIALRTALQAFKPYDSLNELDAILEQLGGTSRAPAVTVIPCTTLLANGYKFADSLIQAQNAWFQDTASWQVGGGTRATEHETVTHITVSHPDFEGPALPVNAPYVAMRTIYTDGMPTMPNLDYEPYSQGHVILLPILGQGPAPFLVRNRPMTYAEARERTRNHTRAPEGVDARFGDVTGPERATFHGAIPLRWAIFYQEQDAEVESPVKKLVMIAFLNHLFDYLDGRGPRGGPMLPGQYQWPDWERNGAPCQPYRPGAVSSTGHDLINAILGETVRSAALRLEYKTAEELPGSQELQLIRAVANLLYFLDHRDLLIRALMNTSSMRQFVTLLLESELIHAGAHVVAQRVTPHGPEEMAIDLQDGVAPEQSTAFLWDRVMTLLPADIFDYAATNLVGTIARFFTAPPRGAAAYDAMLRQFREASLDVNNTELLLANREHYAHAQIKNLAGDMRADYVAAAILNRWRESLPVVIALLKGEIPGFEHLHVAAPNAALSVEVTLNILESMQLMLERDMLSTQNVLEWEEPFAGAHFATAWQAFSVKFPTYPIEYVVHNLATDYLSELGILDDLPLDLGQTPLTAVTAAFQQVGLTLIQCEPAFTFLPLGQDATRRDCYRTFMRGELQACGRTVMDNTRVPVSELYGDVSPAHAALRVTSTYFVRSATIWNQMMEMPRQVVARSYNPQLVPQIWHDYIRMDISDAQLRHVLRHASDRLLTGLWPTDEVGVAGLVHWIDPNPAMRDVAIVLPYVQMLVQTPPEAYDFTMYSRVTFDPTQRICNISGSPVVLATPQNIPGVPDWALPNLSTQMAYQANPLTHMILPLIWNAVR